MQDIWDAETFNQDRSKNLSGLATGDRRQASGRTKRDDAQCAIGVLKSD